MTEKKAAIHVVNEGDPNEAIAPVKVGNPLNAADLAIDQDHMEEFTRTEEGPSEIMCAKPPKGTFFAVFQETSTIWQNRRFYFMLEIPNRDPFLVAPAVAKKKKMEGEDTIRPVLIVRFVTMSGDEGLWALKLDPPDGKGNLWNKSAKKALATADEGKWVRLFSGKGQYTHSVSPRTFEQTPPKMSSLTFDQMINSAFPSEQIVLSLDHQVWEDLAKGVER